MNSITMTWEEKLAETERIHHVKEDKTVKTETSLVSHLIYLEKARGSGRDGHLDSSIRNRRRIGKVLSRQSERRSVVKRTSCLLSQSES